MYNIIERGETMIEINKVNKTYNNSIHAVKDLSISIPNGKIIGIIGPNGAGKSTLIKMMTGVISIDSGAITLNGYDITKNSIEAKKQMGVVFDSPDRFLYLTPNELFQFVASVFEIKNEDYLPIVEELSNDFEIIEVLNQKIESFSHGMRQKVMIIAALLSNPSIWVLDEPLTGLDPNSSYLLKERMKKHTKNGNTVLFSTHVLEVAEKLCDEILIINKGKVLYQGELRKLQNEYPNSTLEEIFLTITRSI